MTRTSSLLLLAVIVVVSAAHGSITAYLMQSRALEPLPFSGRVTSTWDLYVDVTDNDDWTAASLYAVVLGGIFYDDPFNDGNPPDPDLFGFYPDSEFTSFYTVPGDWPNAPYQSGGGTINWEPPTIRDLVWFDTAMTAMGHIC